MATELRDRLIEHVDRLPASNQAALLAVLSSLGEASELRRWSPAVGLLSDEDAEQMLSAIAEGCEAGTPHSGE